MFHNDLIILSGSIPIECEISRESRENAVKCDIECWNLVAHCGAHAERGLSSHVMSPSLQGAGIINNLAKPRLYSADDFPFIADKSISRNTVPRRNEQLSLKPRSNLWGGLLLVFRIFWLCEVDTGMRG